MNLNFFFFLRVSPELGVCDGILCLYAAVVVQEECTLHLLSVLPRDNGTPESLASLFS